MKKKIISLAVVALMLLSCLPFAASAATPFTDAQSGWYVEAVEHVYANKLFKGTTDTTFSPNNNMTRGMFVQVLANFTTDFSEFDYIDQPFMDTDPKKWYGPAVQWAALHGIVGGVGKGNFSPNGFVTREQMATLLYRYAKETGNTITTGDTKYNAFPDKGDTSVYAVEALKWATHNGIINGSEGKLLPKGYATRAQVAQIFLNAKDVLTKKEVILPDYNDVTAEDLTYEQFKTMLCRVVSINMVKSSSTGGVVTPEHYNIRIHTHPGHDVEKIMNILKDCEKETIKEYLEKLFQYYYKYEFKYQNATDFGMKLELSVWNSISVYTVDNLGDSTADPVIPFGDLKTKIGTPGSSEE